MLFDLGYDGSASVKLLAQTQLDQLPDLYLALGDGLNRVREIEDAVGFIRFLPIPDEQSRGVGCPRDV